jgi:hypothetical protein
VIKVTKEPTTEIVPRSETTNVTQMGDPMLAMIERVVLDPNASIEKLERMLAMKERLEDRAREEEGRAQKKAYFTAMSACQAELKVVTKNKKNDHTKSSYADLAALATQADPVIHKHGFTVSFQPAGTSDKGDLRIKWTIAHAEGHVESDTADIPMDAAGSQGKVNKTNVQAFGSTASYGRRYLKLMLFDIATGDDNDGNAAIPDGPITEAQLTELIDLAESVDADRPAFCQFLSTKCGFEIKTFADIPAKRFKDAKSALEVKGRRGNGDH